MLEDIVEQEDRVAESKEPRNPVPNIFAFLPPRLTIPPHKTEKSNSEKKQI